MFWLLQLVRVVHHFPSGVVARCSLRNVSFINKKLLVALKANMIILGIGTQTLCLFTLGVDHMGFRITSASMEGMSSSVSSNDWLSTVIFSATGEVVKLESFTIGDVFSGFEKCEGVLLDTFKIGDGGSIPFIPGDVFMPSSIFKKVMQFLHFALDFPYGGIML